jgi:hypothetical protein
MRDCLNDCRLIQVAFVGMTRACVLLGRAERQAAYVKQFYLEYAHRNDKVSWTVVELDT